MKRKISVIVRTQNRRRLLKEALESIANQSFKPFEVVVVNDGGEEVDDIISRYRNSFESLVHISHPEPLGRSDAANSGLEAATGEFVAFLDDDDLWLPHHLETLMHNVEERTIPYTRHLYQKLKLSGEVLESFSPWEGDFSLELLLIGNFIPLHTLLFPKDALAEIGGFDKELEIFEDWDLLLKLAQNWRFKSVNKVTAIYRHFVDLPTATGSMHSTDKELSCYSRVLERNQQLISPKVLYRNFLHRSALRISLTKTEEELYKLGQQFEKETLSLKKQLNSALTKRKQLEKEKKALQEQVDSLKAQIAQAEKRISQLEEEKKALQELIATMESTLGWKLLERLRSFLIWIAPEGTLRNDLLTVSKYILKQLLRGASGREELKSKARKAIWYLKTTGPKATWNITVSRIKASHCTQEPSGSSGRVCEVVQKIFLEESPALPEISPGSVTVAIPVYNAYEHVKKCLESVVKNTDLSRVHVLVIDDASTDERVWGFLQKLAEEYPIEIIRHASNKGFVATVNEAIEKRRGNLVILNSDTTVPPFWLERLTAPLKDPNIASCTPFSNSATICSFPEIGHNEIPKHPELLDECFKELWGKIEPIEIPTGVGFCMAMSDRALKSIGSFREDVFGRGYGEENDWCLRAEEKGFKNVLVPWLFVPHFHGVSFGEEKKKLEAEAVAKVEQLHPGYIQRVHAFIAEDPPKPIRKAISFIYSRRTGKHPHVLVLSHNMVGGSLLFIKDLMKSLEGTINFTYCKLFDNNLEISIDHEACIMPTDRSLEKLICKLEPDVILINHLITSKALKDVMRTLLNSGKRLIYILHDYYPVCPCYTLTDEKGIFCGIRECTSCTQIRERLPLAGLKSISEWRKLWEKALRKIEFIAPSKAAAEIFTLAYPQANVKIIPHALTLRAETPLAPRAQADKLNVAVIGALNKEKGADLLYALEGEVIKRKLPIKLVLIGYTYRHRNYNGKALTITGPYKKEELPELLRKHEADLVLIPSTWPETFSYTTSEAMAMGLPVVTFDIGAPAERVKKYNAGVVIPLEREPHKLVDSLIETLLHLHHHRDELRNMGKHASKAPHTTIEQWTKMWHNILSS